jgi:hypothetical protein
MGRVVLKSSRLLFTALGAFALAGCSAILGIDGTYTEIDDGGADGSVTGDGGRLPDATIDDGGPGTDATGITDATTLPDVIDAAPVLCADGAVSPTVAAIGSPCCAGSALACDQGQQLELIVCDNGVWAPNGSCSGATLCRFDVGEYPDGGPENDGGIVGNGTGSGQLGTCATEISLCAPHNPGDVFCSGNTLVVCGADLTTAYEETCHKAASSAQTSGTTLCLAHTGPHCPQCLDGVDFACNGNTPSLCSDGGWVAQAPCGAGTFCHSDDGTCQTDVCTPGKSTCIGDDLQTCDAVGDMYQDAGTCPTGTCDGPLGACDTCVKSTNYGCNGNSTYTTCKADGTGITTTTCNGATPFCYEPEGTTTGTCGACLTASNCTGANACQSASCNNGTCSYPAANEGTVVAGPANGSCTETVCKAGTPTTTNLPNGTVSTPAAPGSCTQMTCTNGVAGPSPVPDTPVTVLTKPDGTDCTETICSGGAAAAAPAPAGTACMVGGAGGAAGTCDGTGMDPTMDCIPTGN